MAADGVVLVHQRGVDDSELGGVLELWRAAAEHDRQPPGWNNHLRRVHHGEEETLELRVLKRLRRASRVLEERFKFSGV